MVFCKTAVTPLCYQWGYCSLVISSCIYVDRTLLSCDKEQNLQNFYFCQWMPCIVNWSCQGLCCEICHFTYWVTSHESFIIIIIFSSYVQTKCRKNTPAFKYHSYTTCIYRNGNGVAGKCSQWYSASGRFLVTGRAGSGTQGRRENETQQVSYTWWMKKIHYLVKFCFSLLNLFLVVHTVCYFLHTIVELSSFVMALCKVHWPISVWYILQWGIGLYQLTMATCLKPSRRL